MASHFIACVLNSIHFHLVYSFSLHLFSGSVSVLDFCTGLRSCTGKSPTSLRQFTTVHEMAARAGQALRATSQLINAIM